MANLRAEHGVRQGYRYRPEGLALGRRYRFGAASSMPTMRYQSGNPGPVTRSERIPETSIRPVRGRPLTFQARREQTDLIIILLCIGLVAEAVLPWMAISLSDMFVFDIPVWSRWLVFGAPPVLSLLAVLIHIAVRRSGVLVALRGTPGGTA